jgi:hypothetical protein
MLAQTFTYLMNGRPVDRHRTLTQAHPVHKASKKNKAYSNLSFFNEMSAVS